MEDRVAELELRLAAVEQRLSKLEGQAPGASATDEVDFEPTLGNGSLSNASTLIGRVLLIFGGAYLLRAITENAGCTHGVRHIHGRNLCPVLAVHGA